MKDEKLKEKHPNVRSDFYLNIYANNIILKNEIFYYYTFIRLYLCF